MVSIIHLTSPGRSRVSVAIKQILSREHQVASLFPDSFTASDNCRYLVCCCPAISSITAQGAVLILDSMPAGFSPINIEGNVMAVVSSHQVGDMSIAKGSSLPTVTCGMSGSDTVTLSSITPESAVICLQRTVYTLDGTPVEPCETPVCLSGDMSHHEVMMAAAALFVSGNASLLKTAVL